MQILNIIKQIGFPKQVIFEKTPERSPNMIRLLKEGLLSKSVSSEFLRLYLEAVLSSTSSDI